MPLSAPLAACSDPGAPYPDTSMAREIGEGSITAPQPWLATGAAVFYVLLWASAFVPSRVIATCAPPFWMLSVRFLFAGALLLAIARAAGLRLPGDARTWSFAVAYGVLANAMSLGLHYQALRHLSSGMGAIIASTNPLLLAVLAPFLLRERLSTRKAVGLLLGFLGVLVAMHARAASATARPPDVALAAAGVLAQVLSTIMFKRMRTTSHPLVVNAISLLAAGLVTLPFAATVEGTPHVVLVPRLVVSFAYLVVVLSSRTACPGSSCRSAAPTTAAAARGRRHRGAGPRTGTDRRVAGGTRCRRSAPTG